MDPAAVIIRIPAQGMHEPKKDELLNACLREEKMEENGILPVAA